MHLRMVQFYCIVSHNCLISRCPTVAIWLCGDCGMYGKSAGWQMNRIFHLPNMLGSHRRSHAGQRTPYSNRSRSAKQMLRVTCHRCGEERHCKANAGRRIRESSRPGARKCESVRHKSVWCKTPPGASYFPRRLNKRPVQRELGPIMNASNKKLSSRRIERLVATRANGTGGPQGESAIGWCAATNWKTAPQTTKWLKHQKVLETIRHFQLKHSDLVTGLLVRTNNTVVRPWEVPHSVNNDSAQMEQQRQAEILPLEVKIMKKQHLTNAAANVFDGSMPPKVPLMLKDWEDNAFVYCLQLLHFVERKQVIDTMVCISTGDTYASYLSDNGF